MQSKRARVWLSAATLLCALAWLGHRLVFSQFQEYDDEGYLLLTVQQFLRGLPIYDAVYTQYGPAYYLWQQVLHSVIGIPVTHDATRVVTVAIWLVCSGVTGYLVWLLTKRPLLTAIGVAVSFLHLTQLTFEPGHPQELCLLGVVGVLAIAMGRLVTGRLGLMASVAIGALVALTALTKLNVGAFLAGAVTLALATSLQRSRWNAFVMPHTCAYTVFAAAMVAVPMLMRDDLLRSDIAAWVIVVWGGLCAAFVSRTDAAEADGVVTGSELIACVAGCATVSAVVVAAIVAQGTSPGALFEGLFVAPLLLPKVFWRPLPVPLAAAIAAPLCVCAAVYCRRHVHIVQRWTPLLALGCGMLMFLLSIAKAYGPLFAVGPLLAWLVLTGGARSPGERAARGLLVFAAIFMALQAYPMPDGTQIVLGTVLFVPLALAAIAHAEGTVRANDRVVTTPPSLTRRAVLAVLALAVAANLGLRGQRLYASAVPLAMPGAEAVRTTEQSVATYWWLFANLREHCDGFLTAPGLNSLHVWTGIAPVSTMNTTLWPLLFDDRQQRRILASAAPVERFCVVWSPDKMEALSRAPGIASRSLVAWLEREFEPRASFGDWELRMRRGRRATLVYQAQTLENGGIALQLPALGHEAAVRLAVVEVHANRTLADSAHGEEFVVLDEHGVRTNAARGIDVSRPRRLTVRTAVGVHSSDHAPVVISLWGRDGRLLAIVPLVSTPAASRPADPL
jgi:hypothetical protein